MMFIVRSFPLAALVLLFGASAVARAEYTLYFGGSGGSVELEKVPLPADSDAFTVECRFKLTGKLARPVALISRWSSELKAEDKGAFSLELKALNVISVSLRNDKGSLSSVVARGTFAMGKWHHLAAAWDGTSVSIYLDGVQIKSQKFADFGKLNKTALPLRIGPPNEAKNRKPVAFDGFITDVAVWSQARDAESVKQSLAKPLSGSEEGLAAHVPLRYEASSLKIKTSVGEATLVGSLKSGWTTTPTWHEDEPNRPYVHLFDYDLSAADDTAAGSMDGAFRQILVSNAAKKQAGVLWQNKTSGKIYVTWVEPDLSSHKTVALEAMDNGTLAAGATDSKGNIYYLVISKGSGEGLKANMRSASPDGKSLKKSPMDLSKRGFNVHRFSGRWGSSLQYHKGVLGLILPRTMHKSADGLNHQGGIGVAIAAKTLTVIKNFGQLSGHSFGNVLTVNSRGEFVGLDLGDNYPRGVNMHKFTYGFRGSRVIYTFKTRHDTRARNGSKVYAAISKDGKTFYTSSNDNGVYTELGGVVEGRKSYSVVFATDRSLGGKVLDNSRAFRGHGDPRDLAMLRIVKEFNRVRSGGNEVSDALMAGKPKGATVEIGGFYNFGGGWSKQRVTGVIWLTQYKKDEVAHSPHLLRMRNGNILILWEKVASGRSSLHAMVVQESGKILTEAVDLGRGVRLNRNDPVIRIGDRLLLLGKNTSNGASKLLFVNDVPK
jgi:hypothetical protein